MDALDQQLLTRRIDRIEHKIDRLTELLERAFTPPIILRNDEPPDPEYVERLLAEFRDDTYRPLLMCDEPTYTYPGFSASESYEQDK